MRSFIIIIIIPYLQSPGSNISSRHHIHQFPLVFLIQHQRRTLQQSIHPQRQQLSILRQHQLAFRAVRRTLTAILCQNLFNSVLQIFSYLWQGNCVTLDGGGAGERHGDGGAVDAFEEPRIGLSRLELLVENTDATLTCLVGIGVVKELVECVRWVWNRNRNRNKN